MWWLQGGGVRGVSCVYLARSCSVEFVGQQRSVMLHGGRDVVTLWAVRMRAPRRRTFTIGGGGRWVQAGPIACCLSAVRICL